MEPLKKELSQINDKLSKVLTKDDPSLKQMIKEVINAMKEDLLNSVEHKIGVLESKLFVKEKENDAMKDEIASLKQQIVEQSDENELLKLKLTRVKEDSNEKLNDLEQYGRMNSIRINGVPESDNETVQQTVGVVVETLNAKIPALNLNPSDIDIAHRLGKNRIGQNKGRQIIVKFVSRLTRDNVLLQKKLFRGSMIFVNEDLTRLNQLALSSIRKKMPDEVENAWSRGGKLYFRNKAGSVHHVPYGEYDHWLELPWPSESRVRH